MGHFNSYRHPHHWRRKRRVLLSVALVVMGVASLTAGALSEAPLPAPQTVVVRAGATATPRPPTGTPSPLPSPTGESSQPATGGGTGGPATATPGGGTGGGQTGAASTPSPAPTQAHQPSELPATGGAAPGRAGYILLGFIFILLAGGLLASLDERRPRPRP